MIPALAPQAVTQQAPMRPQTALGWGILSKSHPRACLVHSWMRYSSPVAKGNHCGDSMADLADCHLDFAKTCHFVVYIPYRSAYLHSM